MSLELATDQMLRGTTKTTITESQRRKAVAAVVWRYQRENWTAGELRQVVETLGLLPAQREAKKARVLRQIVGVVDHGTISTVRLSCGHTARREMRKGGKTAVCEECSK